MVCAKPWPNWPVSAWISNDAILTAYVHHGVQRPSGERFRRARDMEKDLISLMQEQAPDLAPEEPQPLYLRETTQRLKDRSHEQALPLLVQRSLKRIAADGLEQEHGTANMRVRTLKNEVMQVTLLKDWATIRKSAHARHDASETVLRHLLSKLPNGARGADLLVEITVGQLTDSLNFGHLLDKSIDADRLLQQALLWLARPGGDTAQPGNVGIPVRHDDPARRGPQPVPPVPLRAPTESLRRADAANPHHGGIRGDGSAVRRRRGAPHVGLLQPAETEIRRQVVAEQEAGAHQADHTGVMAPHRGEPEQQDPTGHRDRRSRDHQGSWFWPGPARARPGCWCTASHT